MQKGSLLEKGALKNTMNILYCGDSNIAEGVILSVMSLKKNVKEPLNIYILTAHVTVKGKQVQALSSQFALDLEQYLKETDKQSSVWLSDITGLFEKELPLANMGTRFTPCCMLRLFADCIEELPDRLLYLDNDVLCRTDCSEFYHQELDRYELCGVPDYYGRWIYKKSILKFYKLDYLNSGVLLLNLKKIRETGLFKKCREICTSKEMLLPDQAALNKLVMYKKVFPRKYNEQHKLRKDTVLQHFTTRFRFFPKFRTVTVKPWDIDRVHEVLKITEYDTLFAEYQEYQKQKTH